MKEGQYTEQEGGGEECHCGKPVVYIWIAYETKRWGNKQFEEDVCGDGWLQADLLDVEGLTPQLYGPPDCIAL